MRRLFARALAALRGRRLRVRPTGRGWQALFFGVLSLVVAHFIGTTQIYQLGYALLALPLAALALGFWLSRGLSHARKLPGGERATAGQETSVELLVSNASRTASPRVEVVDRLPGARFFELPPVDGRGTGRIRVPISFAKRGVYKLGPAEVKTKDPFGLLRFIRLFPETTEVVVYPEVHGLAGFPLKGSGADAGVRGAFSQRGDEFSGLREYRRGDERRHIHWKSVARTGQLVVKEFAASAPRRYAVVVDLQRTGLRVSEAEVEDAISAGASVMSYLAHEGLPSRLILSDGTQGTTEFGSGEGPYWAAMKLLATARADGDRSPAEALEEFPRGELGEGVILILRSVGDGLVDGVTKLRASGLSVVVVAVDTRSYRDGRGAVRGDRGGRDAAFASDLRRLEVAGATVRVLRREGGVRGLGGAYGGARPGDAARGRNCVGMNGWTSRVPLYVAGLAAGAAFSVLFVGGALGYVVGAAIVALLVGSAGSWRFLLILPAAALYTLLAVYGAPPLSFGGWQRLVGQIGLDVWNAMGIMYANPIPYEPYPGLFVIVLPIIVLLVSFATSATLYEGSPVVSISVLGLTIGVLSTVSFEAGVGAFFTIFLLAAVALLLVTAGEGTGLPAPGAVVAGLLVTGVVLSLPAMPFAEAAIRPAAIDWTRIGTGGTSRLAVEADVGDYLTTGRDAELMRIESPEPLLWRGGTLDFFDGVRWSSTTEPELDYGEEVAEGIATRTVLQEVDVLQAETDLLFGGYRMIRVSIPNAQQSTDASWSTRTPLTQDSSYRVLSQIPQPTTAQLTGAGTGYPSEVREKFLQLPENRPSVLPETAQRIQNDYDLANATPYEKARAIERYLIYDGGFTYNLDVDYNRADQAIEEFLGDGKEGFCTQFATSMALLARELDVPSRVVYGATTGQEEDENEYIVTGYNMHTWVEVYFPGVGWYPFEPTPGSEIPSAMQANAPRPELPTAVDEAAAQSPAIRQQQRQEESTANDAASTDSRGSATDGSPAWSYAVYALALSLIVALIPLTKRLLAARNRPEELYRDLTGRLRDALPPGRASLADSPALTPTERLLLLAGVVGVAVGPFREFARAYSESLYAQDPRASTARAYRKALREYATLPLWRRALAALNPASLLLRVRQGALAGKTWLDKRKGRSPKSKGDREDG